MDDNKKKFVNNIVKHIKAFTTAEEAAPVQKDAPAVPEPAEPDKIPVEPVNSEDQIKNAAGKPLKIRGSAASAGEKDSVLSRLAVLLSDRAVLGGVILYAVYIINLIGMTVFTRRSALGLTQALLYKFHIDTCLLYTSCGRAIRYRTFPSVPCAQGAFPDRQPSSAPPFGRRQAH